MPKPEPHGRIPATVVTGPKPQPVPEAGYSEAVKPEPPGQSEDRVIPRHEATNVNDYEASVAAYGQADLPEYAKPPKKDKP